MLDRVGNCTGSIPVVASLPFESGYAPIMRGRLRMTLAGIVFVVICVALIVEPPGTAEGIGLAIVLVAMLVVVLQEWRRLR